MVMMRPEVTAGPIDRARRPEKVSGVKDCAKTGPAAMTARKINATCFIAPLRSPQNHDPICIGPLRVVLDSPAVGCLRELLLVDHHEQAFKWKSLRRLPNQSLEKDAAISDFADFKGDMPTRAHNAGQLAQRRTDHVLPGGFGLVVGYGDTGHVDAGEPASQPVVPGILDD